MNVVEVLRDIVDNRKTAMVKCGPNVLLFKDGLLVEGTGKSTDRIEVLLDCIENDYQNVDVHEVPPEAVISFQEPMDISEYLKPKLAKKISIDKDLDARIQEISSLIPGLKKLVAAEVDGSILSYHGVSEEEAVDFALKVDELVRIISSMVEDIGNFEDSINIFSQGSLFVKLMDGNRYIALVSHENRNIGIIKSLLYRF